jgi:phospholipid/cholesterol/gamma-HCH transport system ATP-binding protein
MDSDTENKIPIRVQGLCKSFGKQMVLDRIDLRVATGETLAVLGRSGTGKSVLLKLLIGLLTPDAGEIEINGHRIDGQTAKDPNKVRTTIGFVFQNAALYDSLTVEENVAFPLRRHMPMTDQKRRDRVRQLLERVGMEDAAAKMPSDISGGMRKRAGLARALALDPAIMLLDEPTAGLDPITANEIDQLIRELQTERHMSSILVTHDMLSVGRVADRIAMLKEGSIVAEGTLADIRRSDDPFVSQYMDLSGEVS